MRKGILYIVLATFFFANMNLLAKYLSEMHFMQVVFFRALGTSFFIMPLMAIQKINPVGHHPWLLMARAICGLLSLALFFWAIQLIPLGSAISIRYVGPAIAALISIFALKEKMISWQWLCFAISFAGVILLKGVDVRISLFGFLITLSSAILLGFVFVLLRYLSQREHYLVIINYFMSISLIGSLFFIPYWRWPIGNEIYAVIGIGVLGCLGQVLMTKAFQRAETNVLAPFKYMELLFAVVIGWFFFQEQYDLHAIFAMSLIIVGMLLNIWVKHRKKAG